MDKFIPGFASGFIVVGFIFWCILTLEPLSFRGDQPDIAAESCTVKTLGADIFSGVTAVHMTGLEHWVKITTSSGTTLMPRERIHRIDCPPGRNPF